MPNAIDLSFYPFAPARGDYLLFLGRMSPDKGAHRAVAVALEAGLPLKIAGKCAEPAEQEYFDAMVRPHLGDGREYVGEVSHGEKVELLRAARATLFPIEWEEPFGLVMIESMACGTPVIATRWGAVPEVIEHGRTGIIVDNWGHMAEALEAADKLDPAEMRRSVEERFTPERMVADYVAAYESVLGLEPRLCGCGRRTTARSSSSPFRRSARSRRSRSTSSSTRRSSVTSAASSWRRSASRRSSSARCSRSSTSSSTARRPRSGGPLVPARSAPRGSWAARRCGSVSASASR